MTVLRGRLLNGRPYLLTLPVPLSAPGGNNDTGLLLGIPGAETGTSAATGTTDDIGIIFGLPGVQFGDGSTGSSGGSTTGGSTGGSTGGTTGGSTGSSGGGTTGGSTGGSTGGTTGGSTGSSGGAVGTMSQSFTLLNWGTAGSATLHKRGVWFKKGDVPAGSVPVLSGGTAQLYGLTRWKDGSLKTARLLLGDTILAASASRAYTVTAAAGTMPAGATAATGNAGLLAALAGHDPKMTFANVRTWDCSTTSGTYAPLGSGAFTASLAAHAATTTRWTVLTTGAVADVWQGWGMATDNSGGGADAHLKVNWYVTRWKKADSTTLALQVGAVVALDWWSTPGKSFLLYDAVLADGTTPVVSYPGVRHHYQSQWLACVNDGSPNAGTAPWIGAAQPTLHCQFDRTYAVSTGLLPPLDTAKRPIPVTQYAYVPCGVVADPDTVAHGESHRPALDAAGGYNGRGVITRFDADAFMAGTPGAYAVARLNALSGLGVPYHYRSNRQRTRPGEAADTANTIIPLLMAPLVAAASDFTAAGLPIAVDAYNGGSSNNSGHDGFVWQTGVTTAASNGYPWYRTGGEPAGTFGPWQPSLDASHAVSYCYYMALVSGDEWLLEAQLDLAQNLAHQGIYGFHQLAQAFPAETAGNNRPAWNPACPTDRWTGLLGQYQPDNMRSLGWAQLIQGHAFGLLPADHPAYGYTRALMAHQGDYIAANLTYLPSDFAAAGFYAPESQLGVTSLFSPWMGGFVACGAYAHYLLNEDIRWKQLGDFAATWSLAQAGAGRWYALDLYRTVHRAKRDNWDAQANPELPPLQQFALDITADLDAPSGTFKASGGALWTEQSFAGPSIANGDPVLFTSETDGGSNGVVPTGAAEGQVAYVVNLQPGDGLTHSGSANPPRFQVAATPGGTPLAWTTSTAGCNLGYRPAAVASQAVASANPANQLAFPYMPTWDNYVPIHVSVIMMARLAGTTAATAAIRDGALAFTAPMDNQNAYYSAFDMATTA